MSEFEQPQERKEDSREVIGQEYINATVDLLALFATKSNFQKEDLEAMSSVIERAEAATNAYFIASPGNPRLEEKMRQIIDEQKEKMEEVRTRLAGGA